MDDGEQVLAGTGGGEPDTDPAHTHLHDRGNLQQLEADRAGGGLGQFGALQADGAQQPVGNGEMLLRRRAGLRAGLRSLLVIVGMALAVMAKRPQAAVFRRSMHSSRPTGTNGVTDAPIMWSMIGPGDAGA